MVRLVYDNDSGIDFNNEEDACFHVRVQGMAGVKHLKDDKDKVVMTRAQLDKASKEAEKE